MGGVSGAGIGLAAGLVVALFPIAVIGGGLLAATSGGGAVLGAVYDSVADAEADYKLVKDLHTQAT